MPRAKPASRPGSPRPAAALVLLLAGLPAVAADSDDARITDQMRADCRAEGEGGGLDGVDLEVYIRECIADLLTVEIGNLEK